MRKFIFMTTVLMLILASYANVYAANNATKKENAISVNGTMVDGEAYISQETVYLPVRTVCEALGYHVDFSQEDGVDSVLVTKSDDEILLNVSDENITDNGHKYYAYGNNEGGSLQIHDGRAYMDANICSEIFAAHVDYDSSAKQVKVSRIVENAISISTEKKADSMEKIDINIQYPQITELKDSAAEKKINEVLEKVAADAQNEGMNNVRELEQSGVTGCNKYATDLNYRIKYNQNNLLSVIFDDYQYLGGAHGGTVQSSYTFDLRTGKVLQLSDILNTSTDFSRYVNSLIRSEIDKRTASGEIDELTKFTSVGENPSYYLSNDSVVFYFQQYEYFPYAAGIQEFPVKFQGLKDKFIKSYESLYRMPITLDKGKDNALSIGDTGQIMLKSNPTTGYEWHCLVKDAAVLNVSSNGYMADSNVIGAGGTSVWSFKALKEGKTTITFSYYRDWEGFSSVKPENTVVYTVTVK